MVKLRNAGFERGTIDFWELVTGQEFTVTDEKAKSGTYSAKIKASDDGNFVLRHKDYIPLERGSIIHIEGEIYPADDGTGYAGIYYYDEEYKYIAGDYASRVISANQWNKVEAEFVPPANAKYFRVGIYGYYFATLCCHYVDCVLLEIYTPQNTLLRHAVLYDSGNNSITSSGDSSSQAKALVGMSKYFASLYAKWNGADSDETLEVKIYDKTLDGQRDKVVGVFTKVTAGDANERIELANVTGRDLYAKWTLGGTTPSWKNVEIEVWGVR